MSASITVFIACMNSFRAAAMVRMLARQQKKNGISRAEIYTNHKKKQQQQPTHAAKTKVPTE